MARCPLSLAAIFSAAAGTLCLGGAETMAYLGHPWGALLAVAAAAASLAAAFCVGRALAAVERARAALALVGAGALETRVVGRFERGALAELDRAVNQVLELTEGYAAKGAPASPDAAALRLRARSAGLAAAATRPGPKSCFPSRGN